MELRHLRYFVAVAEAENVSRAALRLHVSQPALSRQIRDLEGELGFPLLQRSAKSVRLTDAGRVFLIEAQAMLQRVDEGVKAARAVAAGGNDELHVGYAPSLTARILPPTLRAFQVALPKVRVRLHDLSTEEMFSGLRQGELQIALLVRPAPAMLRGLQFTDLATDTMCLAVGSKHPLARKRMVTAAEIIREPLVAYSRKEYPDYHAIFKALFAGVRGRPRIFEEHEGVTGIIAAVEAGVGVALVSESLACMAGPRLKLIAISPPLKPAVIGAAWIGNGFSAAAARFIECAREVTLKGRVTVAGS